PPSAEDCTSAFSNRGPITRPSTSGAIGKLIRFMRKPTTPNTTTTQRLKVLFATANAPISAVKMMSGYRYEYGRRKSCAKTGARDALGAAVVDAVLGRGPVLGVGPGAVPDRWADRCGARSAGPPRLRGHHGAGVPLPAAPRSSLGHRLRRGHHVRQFDRPTGD